MKGKTGLVFTETGQAEVEIPKEKDAKHSTVSSRNREICGTQAGARRWEYGAKLVIWQKKNELGATSF